MFVEIYYRSKLRDDRRHLRRRTDNATKASHVACSIIIRVTVVVYRFTETIFRVCLNRITYTRRGVFGSDIRRNTKSFPLLSLTTFFCFVFVYIEMFNELFILCFGGVGNCSQEECPIG